MSSPHTPEPDNSGPPYTLDGMDPVLRDLVVCAVHGAMATRAQPPTGHWLTSSWQLGYAMRREGEVVAWVNGDELDNLLDDRTALVSGKKDGWRSTPLYRFSDHKPLYTAAAPEPLTDERIDDIAETILNDDSVQSLDFPLAFARAIEAALLSREVK